MISVAMYIGSIIATAVITSLVFIFLTPVRNWVYSTRKEQCAYEKTMTGNPTLKDVIVTTKRGKTSHISCYWFNRREPKIVDGISYKHCVYGEKFLTPKNKRGAAQCPFHKQYS
ncbi:MAG: hypothetical protein IIC75_03425 [Bacteroidetes bacterium]|nr:hypothetical protein [Bacteroidota bacterium]